MILQALIEAAALAASIVLPLLIVAAVPTRIRRKVNAAFQRLGF